MITTCPDCEGNNIKATKEQGDVWEYQVSYECKDCGCFFVDNSTVEIIKHGEKKEEEDDDDDGKTKM